MLIPMKLAGGLLALTLVACNPAPQNATKAANATDATQDPDAEKMVEARYAEYPEDSAYLFHGGSVDRSIRSETLNGTGPNKSLKFFVDYRGQAGWNASEFRRGGRRHCRWNYTHNGIARHIYVYRSENNKEEVASGKLTQAGSIPGPDETADNCNSVQNNVIIPLINQITSVEAWSTFIEEDKARVKEILNKPI